MMIYNSLLTLDIARQRQRLCCLSLRRIASKYNYDDDDNVIKNLYECVTKLPLVLSLPISVSTQKRLFFCVIKTFINFKQISFLLIHDEIYRFSENEGGKSFSLSPPIFSHSTLSSTLLHREVSRRKIPTTLVHLLIRVWRAHSRISVTPTRQQMFSRRSFAQLQSCAKRKKLKLLTFCWLLWCDLTLVRFFFFLRYLTRLIVKRWNVTFLA